MTRALGTLSRVHSGLATGFCSAVDCSAMTGVVINMQDIILNLLGYGHDGVPGNHWYIVYQLFLILHHLPSGLTG